jgi:hypothetical protein
MVWWLCAAVLAIRGTGVGFALAGAAAALATLTRPNLVVLALPILLYVIGRPGTRRERIGRGTVFALSMLPGPIAIAAVNQHLYGAPFASGYGTLSTIYAFLLALAASAFAHIAPRAGWTRAAAFSTVVILLAGWGIWMGREAFRVRADESRYVVAGRFARELPENAVILCNQHSGSLRYYANRITMRFEWLDADMYRNAVDHIRGLGRPLFVVLDDWERDVFRQRYAGAADLSWLDEPPLLLAARRVYFYQVVPPPAPRGAGL